MYKMDNVFQRINLSMANFITYSESQMRLLPPPYLTNCTEYGKNSEHNTRNDCVQKCVDRGLQRQFNLTCVWSNKNFKLMRRDSLQEQSKMGICWYDSFNCAAITAVQYTLINVCEDLCPKNCFESFYTYEVKPAQWRPENRFSININHNRFFDQVIEHKPILDWITLVSNLAGLLGMWLGFSFAFTMNHVINMISDKISNKYIAQGDTHKISKAHFASHINSFKLDTKSKLNRKH